MKVTITSLELKTPFKFFILAYYSMNVLKQLSSTRVRQQRTTGFWTRHYTMTLWESEDELKRFAREGAHKTAMKKSRFLAKEIRVLTIDADQLPDWKTAKTMLLEKGEIYRY